MEKWKKEYENIVVPKELKEQMERSIESAHKDKKRIQRVRAWRALGSAAAVMAIVLILPNTSQRAAAAMQQLPVLGDFFKVVTVREYQVDEEHQNADVKVPKLVPDTEGSEAVDEETVQQVQQTAEEINFDIQTVTDELIEEFRESMEEYEDGYQDLYIGSEVLTDTDRWFSLELVLYQGAGSGYERRRHYTIDKTTGKQAELSELCGDDYVETISEEVKAQMRQQMAEDENKLYWLDDEEFSEWNFTSIAEDQDFYVDKEGRVVICFDEYEVAPGYMGYVEFIMPLETFKKN